MTRFKGKAVLVANAAGALGRAAVHRFAAEGAQIMSGDVDLKAAEALAAMTGGRATALDATREDGWASALDATVSAFGRLDILVHIAAAAYEQPTAIADTTLERFRAVTTCNLEGGFLGLKAAVVKMRQLGHGGSIVTVTSAYATVGLSHQAALNASANGLRMMTKAAALSCAEARDGIRVNAVLAGIIADPRDTLTAPKNVPLGRRGTPEDVAAAVAYLASDDASYVTGYILPVDGGLLAA